MKSATTATTWSECVCGGLITERKLPRDIAEAAGRTHLWVHDHGDIYCYPDDENACAEPYELATSSGEQTESFVGSDGTVYGSSDERRFAEQRRIEDYERMKSGEQTP